MPDWDRILLLFLLIPVAMTVRRDRTGGAFLVLLFSLGMISWIAFALSGGQVCLWIGQQLTYWEDTAGSLMVGAALVLTALTVLHLLIWLARLLTAGPRRPDTSAVAPGGDAASGNDSGWEVFSGDIGGDCGGVD